MAFIKLAAKNARDGAEEYFKIQNLETAIKFAEAAKHLYPELAGIDDCIASYDIYKAVSKNRSWYEALGIDDPSVSPDIIQKQYMRMAFMVHPDRNSSIAAEGAFQLVSMAWDVLSDPMKRKAYDSHMGYRYVIETNASSSSSSPAMDHRWNGQFSSNIEASYASSSSSSSSSSSLAMDHRWNGQFSSNIEASSSSSSAAMDHRSSHRPSSSSSSGSIESCSSKFTIN